MLLDIGVGIILGIIADGMSDMHASSTFVLFGIFAALSPDMDFIYHLLTGGTVKDDHRHREVLHQPIFLFVGALLIAGLFSPILGLLFLAGALSHFVHDSIGIGWGVQWLYPIKTDHYTFLYRVHTADKPKPPRKLIYVWPNKDIDDLNEKYGDEEWFKNTYIKLHPFAIIETVVFVAALALLWLTYS